VTDMPLCPHFRKHNTSLLEYGCPMFTDIFSVVDLPHLRSSEDNKLFVPRSLTASTCPRAFCSSGLTS